MELTIICFRYFLFNILGHLNIVLGASVTHHPPRADKFQAHGDNAVGGRFIAVYLWRARLGRFT